MKERFEGKVIWFDQEKGYGFLYWSKENIRQKDLFCHFSDVDGEGFKKLDKNQMVTFELGENRNGHPKALKVSV